MTKTIVIIVQIIIILIFPANLLLYDYYEDVQRSHIFTVNKIYSEMLKYICTRQFYFY